MFFSFLIFFIAFFKKIKLMNFLNYAFHMKNTSFISLLYILLQIDDMPVNGIKIVKITSTLKMLCLCNIDC